MAIIASGQITLTDLNDAKSLLAYVGSNVAKTQIYNPADNTFTPNWTGTNAVLTPELYVSGVATNIMSQAKSVTWYANGVAITSGTGGYTIAGTNPKALTIAQNKLSDTTPSIKYLCEIVWTDTDVDADITVKADIEMSYIKGGTAVVTATLSNDSATVPTDATGTAATGVYTSTGTEVHVYEGATELTYDGVGTSNGTYKVTATGTGITPNATPVDSGLYATYGVASNMTTDTASISFAIVGKRMDGTAISITRVQTFAKAKTGGAGTTPTAYWINGLPSAIKKATSAAGVITFSPTNFAITSRSQTGTGTPAVYSGRFKVYTANTAINASTNWGTAVYTSAANESTYTYPATGSFATDITGIKVELYLAGGTTTLVDDQIIPVVEDGSNAITVNVWTPNGNMVRNSTGSVTAQADIYNGGTAVSASAYKWYIQDPVATAVSGGDADGGAGWRLMPNDGTAPGAVATFPAGSAGGTLPAGNYYVKYTWITPSGETVASGEATKTGQVANNTLVIQVPAFTGGVVGAKVYVGTATGVVKYQGTISTSNGTLTINAPIKTNTAAPPVAYTGVTGVATATITIPASSILGSESFKSVATYNSVKYSGVATVTDVSDPVQVAVLGVDTFKNGQGSTTLTAKLVRSGVEIDAAGTDYTYTWSLYDENLVKDTAWNTTGSKTGKTITVNATDINVRGSIVCEVSQ